MEINKILHNHIRSRLFNFFTDDDINDWSFNTFDDTNYVLHKIYDKKHLYMITYTNNTDNNMNINQYYYELKKEIDDDGSCPIINGKIKYETVKNIVSINNEIYMICHQDYIFNKLLLIDFKNLEILYDNGSNVYSTNEYLIEGNNYIFYVYDDDTTIDIFLNMIDKKITIYENNKLTYYLCCDIYDPNLVY